MSAQDSNTPFCLKLRLHGRDVKDVALESGRQYTFGRGSDCDVQLDEQPGISRMHFRLSDVDGVWEVQVLSKFGTITYAGAPVESMKLEVGSVFKIAGYDFLFTQALPQSAQRQHEEEMNAENQYPMASGQSDNSFGAASSNLPARLDPSEYEGSDEATQIIAAASTGVPYIRVVEGSGREETIKLDGRNWIAGRDDSSQILLNDRKASRRQFELMSSPQGNFVRDLGSSNGTLLNGNPLAADELKAIRSGDVIQVGNLTVHFEVRDPHFEKRLMVVPKEVLSTTPPLAQQSPYEMINFPVPSGPGGAVRIDQSGAPAVYEPQSWADPAAAMAKKKKIRFYAIAALVVLPIVAMLANEDKPPAKTKAAAAAVTDGFSKLTPQQQQQVKEMMILGRNLYMQGKQALAAEQLRKLHEILPEGFENSLAIAAECRAQAEQEQRRLEVEREMKQVAENRVLVDQNLLKCEPMSNSTTDESALRSCLAPSFERDPGNPRLQEFINRVRARSAARDEKLANQKDYASRVARGRALFYAAEALEKQGDGDSAVEAYRKHLASSLPDPDGLRAKSQRKVGALEQNKAASIAKYLEAAQLAFTNQNYPVAVNNINKIKSLDPRNSAAAELNANIQRQKNQKLREIYEESVINEGLGQIELAKGNWKRILDMDHVDGEYYKRAKNKMRAFGGGT